jgi:tetratricopeptide (TPR) repeat protein
MRLVLLSMAMVLAQPSLAARTPLQAYVAGDYSLALRDYNAASRYFGAALAAAPDDILLRRRAFELALTSGNFDRALLLANQIAKNDQSISSVNQLLVIDAIRRKDWTSASKMANAMPEAGIDAVLVPLLKCWAAVGKRDMAAANDALDALERKAGMASFRQHQTAWVAAISGDTDRAKTGMAELTKTPAQAGTNNLIAAAALMSANGKGDAALKLLSYDAPERLPSAIVRAIETLTAGKALPLPLRTPQEGLASALSILANELARDDIKGASVNLAQLAAWLAPNQTDLKLALAEILGAADRDVEARQILEDVQGTANSSHDLVIARARIFAQNMRYDEARALLEKAIATEPNRAEFHMVLGDTLRAAEKFDAAILAYNRAIELQPRPLAASNWGAFFARGVCFERLKQWDKVEADLKQAMALRPDDATLLNYLGYSWLDQGRNVAEATKMIERALELRPGDGAIIDSLGWAHFKAGRVDQAIELLEQAIAAVPGDPTVNEHLGDAYWAVGRTVEARHRWAAALESDPENDQQARLAQKIDFGMPQSQAS